MRNFEKHIKKNHSVLEKDIGNIQKNQGDLAKDISDLVKHIGSICLIQLH